MKYSSLSKLCWQIEPCILVLSLLSAFFPTLYGIRRELFLIFPTLVWAHFHWKKNQKTKQTPILMLTKAVSLWLVQDICCWFSLRPWNEVKGLCLLIPPQVLSAPHLNLIHWLQGLTECVSNIGTLFVVIGLVSLRLGPLEWPSDLGGRVRVIKNLCGRHCGWNQAERREMDQILWLVCEWMLPGLWLQWMVPSSQRSSLCGHLPSPLGLRYD